MSHRDSDIATSNLLPQVLPQEETTRGTSKFTDRAIKNLKPSADRYELLEGGRADSEQGCAAVVAMEQSEGDHAQRRHRLARSDCGSRRTDRRESHARRGQEDVQLRAISRSRVGQPLRAGQPPGQGKSTG